MSGGHEWAQQYETAMRLFRTRLSRADDGTIRLNAEDYKSIGLDDPTVFAQLKEALEETNRKIRRGEIDPKQVDLEYLP
jgi:hypothetical protein